MIAMNPEQDTTVNNSETTQANPGTDFLPGSLEFTPPEGSAPGREGHLRVLLVDDHDDMLTMMRVLMSRRNFHVVTANSPFLALELMQRFNPHVVVSDIGMPDMDGYELMKKLRDQNSNRTFKAIALSGFDLETDRELSRAAGYDAHLSKPINFDLLFEMISRLANSPGE